MRHYYIPVLVAILIGCEQVVELELPYEERIVVNGYIGLSYDSALYISRTLPVGEVATWEKAAIREALVTLRHGAEEFQCLPDPEQIGRYMLPLADSSWYGTEVTLEVRAGGLYTWVTTVIPKPTPVISAKVTFSESVRASLTATVVAAPNTAISVGTAQTPFQVLQDTLLFKLHTFRGTQVALHDVTFRPLYGRFEGDSIVVALTTYGRDQVRALDNAGSRGESVFGFAGSNPFYNVEGDGIGLFLGRSRSLAYAAIVR